MSGLHPLISIAFLIRKLPQTLYASRTLGLLRNRKPNSMNLSEQALADAGLKLHSESLEFEDGESTVHEFKFKEINEVSVFKPHIQLVDKLLFWLAKLTVRRTVLGVVQPKVHLDDYREKFELEIELRDGRYFNRRIGKFEFLMLEEWVADFNAVIAKPHRK